MKIRKKLLVALGKILPVGSATTIHDRLAIKGLHYSIPYIYRVLNPDNADYNSVIIEEAVAYSEEIMEKKKAVEGRIRNLLQQCKVVAD